MCVWQKMRLHIVHKLIAKIRHHIDLQLLLLLDAKSQPHSFSCSNIWNYRFWIPGVERQWAHFRYHDTTLMLNLRIQNTNKHWLPEKAMSGGAVDADSDAEVDRGPSRIGRTAVGTSRIARRRSSHLFVPISILKVSRFFFQFLIGYLWPSGIRIGQWIATQLLFIL